MVSLRQMKIFLEVATLKKMSLASESLYVSQPTISQAISEIESQYNVRLFERFGKRLALTPQGRMFFEHATTILTAYENMNTAMNALANYSSLHVGATITVGARIASRVIKAYSTKNPSIDVRLYVNNIMTLEQKLLSNGLDVGIVSIIEGQSPNPNFVFKPLLRDRLVLVCSAANPLAERDKISLADICNEPFILTHSGNGIRNLFEEKIGSQKKHINIKCECADIYFTIDNVINNVGLAILSDRLIKRQLDNGQLRILNVEGCQWYRNFCVVYHKKKYMSDSLVNFLEVCNSFDDNSFADLSLL